MHNARATAFAFIVTLGVFVGLDASWLSLVAVRMFQNQLGPVLRSEPQLAAVIAFYPIYAFGLLTLAVRPGVDARSLTVSATKGAVLGLTAYATFDLTNLAVIDGWTLRLAFIDVMWGITASAVASLAGCAAGLRAAGSARAGSEMRE